MTFISLDEAKSYLRVDSSDEDAVIGSLLAAAGNLCRDVARLTDAQWADIDSDKCCSKNYCRARLTEVRETLRVAILYALGYLFVPLLPSHKHLERTCDCHECYSYRVQEH